MSVGLDRTSAKDFVRFPHLLDQHIERIVAANKYAKLYMRDTALRTTGLIQIENFTGSVRLQSELMEEIRFVGPGDSKRQDSILASTPHYSSARVIANAMRKEIVDLFVGFHQREAVSKFESNLYLQHLYNTPFDNDKQKVFHSDTFFPAIKFWYFPHAVGPDDGPFMYVPYSPLLSFKLLEWHRAQIDNIKRDVVEEWRGEGHYQGSLRISPEELTALGLEPKAVAVRADTLVIANVFGFHRRGDTAQPTRRLSLHGSVRIDKPI